MRHSDAVIAGTMVIVKTAERKIKVALPLTKCIIKKDMICEAMILSCLG